MGPERPAAPTRIGQPLTGHTDAVSSVAFNPAGTTLATAGGDRTVILWDLRGVLNIGDDAVSRACHRVGQGLSSDEWRQYVTGIEYRETCAMRSQQ